MKKVFRIILLLLLLYLCFKILTCNNDDQITDGNSEAKTEETTGIDEPPRTDDTSILDDKKAEEEAKTKNKPSQPDPKIKRYPNLGGYKAMCSGSTIDLSEPVLEIATDLESQQFVYNSANLADCSGMFHRMLKGIKNICPEQLFPAPAQARDTRALAKWYHTNSKLTLITDVLAQRDLIKPGAVMFYGNSGIKYEDFKAEDLFIRGTGINHVGIVVDVEKDKDGKVTNYHLFHGRNTKYTAGITKFHTLVPSRDQYPPLGNGRQQWVAFATVAKDFVQ